MGRIAVLFILVPLVELAILLRIGEWIGFLPTFALVILTGVAGAALAHRQGLRTLARIRTELAAGRAPVGHMIDGLVILVAGVLLLTPGVLTDLCGLALLLPGPRGLFKRFAARRLAGIAASGRLNVTIFHDG